MSIDLKTIKHISKLSRISVDEKKAEKLAGDLNSIFDFIEKLNELKSGKTDMKEGLSEITKIAEDRMLATKDMLATKGRASFLGERAKGHIDPGARSSQLIIDTICKSLINK